MVNRVKLPQATLPILLSFPRFHAFWGWNLGMMWDSNSPNMEELNVNEREWAMGFQINTITMPNIFEGACRQNLGQVIDIDCLTWLFGLVSIEQTQMAHSCPCTHLTHTLVGLLVGTTMLLQATNDVVTSWVVHPWHTWGHECQKGFMGVGKGYRFSWKTFHTFFFTMFFTIWLCLSY